MDDFCFLPDGRELVHFGVNLLPLAPIRLYVLGRMQRLLELQDSFVDLRAPGNAEGQGQRVTGRHE